MPQRAPDRPGVCERCLQPIADLRDRSSFEAYDFVHDDRDFIICAPCVEDVDRISDEGNVPFAGIENWTLVPVDLPQDFDEEAEGADPHV